MPMKRLVMHADFPLTPSKPRRRDYPEAARPACGSRRRPAERAFV